MTFETARRGKRRDASRRQVLIQEIGAVNATEELRLSWNPNGSSDTDQPRMLSLWRRPGHGSLFGIKLDPELALKDRTYLFDHKSPAGIGPFGELSLDRDYRLAADISEQRKLGLSDACQLPGFPQHLRRRKWSYFAFRHWFIRMAATVHLLRPSRRCPVQGFVFRVIFAPFANLPVSSPY